MNISDLEMEWHNKGAILFFVAFFLLKYWLQFHLNTSHEKLSCLYLGVLGGVLEDDLL